MDRKLLAEAKAVGERHGGDDGEDLGHELIVGVLERGVGLREPGAWMERVGRNATIDAWRREKTRAELACDIPGPEAVLDPEAVLLLRERREMVRRAVAALPRAQRRATIARFHRELSFDEVAARTDSEVVTARTRVHRALLALRQRLSALRAIVVIPGVQASALGLALLVPELAVASRPIAISDADSGGALVPGTSCRRGYWQWRGNGVPASGLHPARPLGSMRPRFRRFSGSSSATRVCSESWRGRIGCP